MTTSLRMSKFAWPIGRAAATQLGIVRIDNQLAVFIGDVAYTAIGIIDDVKRNPDLLLSVVIPVSTATRPTHSRRYLPSADRHPTRRGCPGGRQAPLALRPDHQNASKHSSHQTRNACAARSRATSQACFLRYRRWLFSSALLPSRTQLCSMSSNVVVRSDSAGRWVRSVHTFGVR